MTAVRTEQNRDHQEAEIVYLITWACYGTWLPGQSGAVPETQNRFGAPLPEPNAGLEQHSRKQLMHAPYRLDAMRRQIVLESLQQVCSHRHWNLWAAHVRSNHVHVVTAAHCKPEEVMTAMKAYSSRALNSSALDPAYRIRWARHGSTRYLWAADSVRAAIKYVVHEQGELMAVFEKEFPLANARGSAG